MFTTLIDIICVCKPVGHLIHNRVKNILHISLIFVFISVQNEFREYPAILRHAVSIGRRLQDPLAEFSALCVEEDELLCLKLHPLQVVALKHS